MTPSDGGMLLHTRLTHSQKVAQIARSIAEALLHETANHKRICERGGLDADVAEVAALAHDLGHPPFGHIGEETLDDLAQNLLELPEGFEGNAQSFRIVTKLEQRSLQYEGMDLVRAARAAILKYPWPRLDRKPDSDHEEALKNDAEYRRKWRKFNLYETEREDFEDARGFLSGLIAEEAQSLEAAVMDMADDITYAIHDLEDFYQAQILDVRAVQAELRWYNEAKHELGPSPAAAQNAFAQLAQRLSVDYAGYFKEVLFRRAVAGVLTDVMSGLDATYVGSYDQVAKVKSLASDLIGNFLKGIQLTESPAWRNGPYVALDPESWHKVQVFKELTRTFVVQRPDTALMQRGQQLLLTNLVNLLMDWKQSKSDFRRLPRMLRDEIDKARADGDPYSRGPENRAVVDYICSLTDQQCINLYQALAGLSLRGLTDRFVL